MERKTDFLKQFLIGYFERFLLFPINKPSIFYVIPKLCAGHQISDFCSNHWTLILYCVGLTCMFRWKINNHWLKEYHQELQKVKKDTLFVVLGIS